jgi:hypothetical protein
MDRRFVRNDAMPVRQTAFTVGAILFAATAVAHARPDSRKMTCEQTQRLIQSHRAAVLTTGRNTYDRYVRPYGNECDWPEVPTVSFIPTLDGQCLVHQCEEPVFDFRWR